MLSHLALHITRLYFGSTGDPCQLPGSGTNSFFGFPHWWKYLNGQIDSLGKCAPVIHPPGGLWAIALAVIDILLRLAGIAAVISIIIAGISYIGAAGASDKITAARKRIVNSLIGLAIVLIAAAVVSFIGNSLG
jgi:hypothetical protein